MTYCIHNASFGSVNEGRILWQQRKSRSFSVLHDTQRKTVMAEELTNLRWLSDNPATRFSAPGHAYLESESNSVLMQMIGTPLRRTPCFPITGQQSDEYPLQRFCHSSSYANWIADPLACARPSCSYTCLIAMALKASKTGALIVSEIYRFIE